MKRDFKRLTILFIFIFISIQGIGADSSSHLTFWDQKAGTPAERFELAKRSTPELIAFVRPMPKGADLHNHVSGATYSDYIIERAEKMGLKYDTKHKEFTYNDNDYTISIQAMKSNSQRLQEFLDAASLRGWHRGNTNGHDHFFAAFNHIRVGRGSPEEIIAEIISRNRYENLQYLELMVQCIPNDIPPLFDKALVEFDMDDLESAFNQVKSLLKSGKSRDSIRHYLDERDRKIEAILGEKYPLTGNPAIRYITQLYRELEPRRFFLATVIAFLAERSDDRVVGVTLVAPEDYPASRNYFPQQMDILDFLWHKMGGPNINLHAGELVLKDSPVEPMMNRIGMSIKKGHSRRIGHGISIAWEKNLVELLSTMKNQGILVEICLSSNESILGIQGKDHPFSLYRRAGVPVSINTDDEGISRSNLTMEYIKAIQRYDLNYRDVKDLVRNSLEYSFLPGQSLYVNRDYKQLAKGFAGIRAYDWQPCRKAKKIMNNNPKLNRQVVLERAFVTFEKALLDGFKSVDH